MFFRILRHGGTKTLPLQSKKAARVQSRGIIYSKAIADPKLRKLMEKNHLFISIDQKEFKKIRKIIDQTSKKLSSLDSHSFEQLMKNKTTIPSEKIPNSSARQEKQTVIENLLISGDINLQAPAELRQVRLIAYSNSNNSPERIEFITKNIIFPSDLPSEREEFSQIFDSNKNDFNALEKNNIMKVAKHQQFINDVENITSHKKPSESKNVIKDLENYMYTEKGGIDRFSSEELNHLMILFWNYHASDSIMEMVIESKNGHFKKNLLTLELFAKCALSSPAYYNPFIAISTANIILEKDPHNFEAYSILGIAHESRNDCAKKLLDCVIKDKIDAKSSYNYRLAFPNEELYTVDSVKENYENTLALSTYFYGKAFDLSLESRYGARLMHRQLLQNNTNEASATAEVIQMTCIRDHVMHTKNLATVKNFLEATYVKKNYPEKVEWMEAKLLTLCQTQKQSINTLHAFKQIHNIQKDEDSGRIVKKLEAHIKELASDKQNALTSRQKDLSNLPLPTNEESWGWQTKTYSYTGLTSNIVEGSLKTFGGQLPAHEVNRYTKAFFEKILDIPIRNLISNPPSDIDPNATLMDMNPSTDIDKFLNSTDLFLREQFKTDEWNLEVITSPGHKKFDRIVNGTIQLAGIPKDSQSRKLIKQDQTNLAMNLYSRLGDCRQHSQSKQLLFDTWMEKKSNEIISKLKDREYMDAESVNQLQQAFNDLQSTSLKLWDMEVGYYDADNNYIKIEEHSANVKLKLDSSGNLTDVAISDAFYQTTYDFKDRSLDFQGKVPDRHSLYDAGNINVNGNRYSLVVKSAGYSGPKEKYDKSSNQNHFVGLPEKQVTVDEMLVDRSIVDARHDEIESWHLNSDKSF